MRRAPLALAATVTTAWAALVSLAPIMTVIGFAYAVDSTGAPIHRVVRVGLAGWLLANGVPVRTPEGPVGLVPLAFTALVAWRLVRAGVHTARAVGARRRRSAWWALASATGVGAVYGVIGSAVAAAARLPGMSVSILRAALTLALFGLLAGLAGAVREAGVTARLVRDVPEIVRTGVRTGAVAALLVLGAGAATAGTAVAFAGGEASQMLADYDTGVLGQAGLTVVCLLYSPNISVWAASFLVGPGFVIGDATTVSAGHVILGPLPAVPALSGLPSETSPGWGALLLGLPLAAGMAAGWLLVRRAWRAAAERRTEVPSLAALLTSAALAGPAAGGLLGLASLAASGSLGGGRLAHIGPRTLPVVTVSAMVVTFGTVIAAAATRGIVARRGERWPVRT